MSEDKKSDNGINWYITGGILIAAAVIIVVCIALIITMPQTKGE